ncbi:MAG: FG-GAP-like repeat-containing protein, partial [bacterium]
YEYDSELWQLKIKSDLPFGLSETVTAGLSTAVSSAEGVPMAAAYQWSFGTAKPKVIDVVPDSGMLNVANNAVISATFNGEMNATTFSETTVQVTGVLTGTHTGSITYDAASRTLSFDPTTDFVVGEVVTVKLTTGILSMEGAKLEPAYTWTFSTKSPEVTAVSPTANRLNVNPGSSVTVTFDMAMRASSFGDSTLVIMERTRGKRPGTLSYDPATRTATFTPTGDFQVGDAVTVMATIGLLSDGGVRLAQGYIWTFTVAVESGSGSFSGQVNYETGSNPRSVAAADFDGDGAIDLITANSESDNARVLWNNGSGVFSTFTTLLTDGFPCQVVASDIGRDGYLDIMVVNYASNSVSYLPNNNNTPGPRDFRSQVKMMVGDGPRGLVLADLTGDGYVDLVTANMYSNDITVYLHSGLVGQDAAAYDTSYTYRVGTSPRKVVAADFDGDMDLDLATANAFSDDVTILFNHGDGTFDTDAGAIYLAVGDHPYSLASADLDGDGDLDLVTTDAWTDQVTVLVNDGDGNFVSSSSYDVDQFPRAVCAADADFDGDGMLDLVTVNADDNTLSLLLNNGAGGFNQAISYAIGRFPFGLCTVDVDGDGDLDVVTANSADNNLTVLFNGGTATAVEGGSLTLPVAYSLEQNYPNPFNPTTTIEYTIGRPADVTLEIFNTLGQRVFDLDLGHQNVGVHRLSWDGRDRDGKSLSSGVYFYRLAAGDFTQTKKMVLMK